MGYQFAHIYAFSQGGKYQTAGCLGEAFRDSGYCSHVADPRQPTPLYGSRKAVENALEAYRTGFKDERGHKLRKDGRELLGGVFSWPPGTEKKDFEQGNKILLEFLRKEYGPALRCVVPHYDEPFLDGEQKGETHFHTHWLVVPDIKTSLREYHPGIKAKVTAERNYKAWLEKKGEGEDPPRDLKHRDLAYKRAMADWNDTLNKEVGAKLGLVRLGPRRNRYSQREQSILNNSKKLADGIIADAHRVAANLMASAENEISGLKKREAAIQKREEALAEGRAMVLKKWDLPGLEKGEVFPGKIGIKFSYFERVWDWAAGLVENVTKRLKEVKAKEKELEQKETE